MNQKLENRISVLKECNNMKLAAEKLGITQISLSQYFNKYGFDFRPFTFRLNEDGSMYKYDSSSFNDKEFYSYFIGFFFSGRK